MLYIFIFGKELSYFTRSHFDIDNAWFHFRDMRVLPETVLEFDVSTKQVKTMSAPEFKDHYLHQTNGNR